MNWTLLARFSSSSMISMGKCVFSESECTSDRSFSKFDKHTISNHSPRASAHTPRTHPQTSIRIKERGDERSIKLIMYEQCRVGQFKPFAWQQQYLPTTEASIGSSGVGSESVTSA